MPTSLICLVTMVFQPHLTSDLTPYLEDDYLTNLRSNPLQQGEDDGGPSRQPSLDPQII